MTDKKDLQQQIQTIHNVGFTIEENDHNFNYQLEITKKLDDYDCCFDQNILNEIVLWKVNRYASFSEELIGLINSIDKSTTKIDVEKTKLILKLLLNTKGVQLPMASSIQKSIYISDY